MEHEECQYKEKIVEMATDIKWLVSDAKERNHKFEGHIKESDHFRRAVTRNVEWRIYFKIAISVIGGVLIWILKQHYGG